MQNKTNCCKKMLMAAKNNKVGKCYNSVSCILSVLIIVFCNRFNNMGYDCN